MDIDHSVPRLIHLLLLFSLSLIPNIFLLPLSQLFFTPLSYLLPIRSRFSLKPSQFSPTTHLLSRCKAPRTWTSPAPAAHQPLSLVPVPRAACLHILPFLCLFAPPFAALSLHPGPCWPRLLIRGVGFFYQWGCS